MSLHFSAIGFIPECFGDLNDEKTVICNTSSHSQSIVGATYSINGINSGGDGECVCLCVRAGVCGSGACGLVYVCMCMLECVSVYLRCVLVSFDGHRLLHLLQSLSHLLLEWRS